MPNTITLQPHTIHVTSRREFKTCRRRYRYSHIDRLAPITTLQSTGPFWFGSGIHHALALYYQDWMIRQKDPNNLELSDFSDLLVGWEDYKSKSNLVCSPDMNEMGIEMLRGYQRFSAEKDAEWEIVAVEVNLQMLIPGTDVILEGTIDLIVRYQGYLWIVDHKTASVLPNANQLSHDDQMTAYVWLCHQHGLPVRGIYYNALRKKTPTKPEVLVRGGLSKNKQIDTTHYVYLEALEEQYGSISLVPVGEYDDILAKLTSKTYESFFVRYGLTRSRGELETFGEQLVHEAREMTDPNTFMYTCPGQTCNYCDFSFLCKVENEKGDTKSAIESMFRVKGDTER